MICCCSVRASSSNASRRRKSAASSSGERRRSSPTSSRVLRLQNTEHHYGRKAEPFVFLNTQAYFRRLCGIQLACQCDVGERIQGRERIQGKERRNIPARAAVVQRVINGIVQNPSVTLTVDTLQAWLNIPFDAAERILARLASSGLIREVHKGVWTRATWPGAQREWY